MTDLIKGLTDLANWLEDMGGRTSEGHRSNVRDAIAALTSRPSGTLSQEPAAWQHRIYFEDTGKWSEWRHGKRDVRLDNLFEERPLFASPPVVQGVTEEQVEALDDDLLEDFREETRGDGAKGFPKSNIRKLIAEIDRLRAGAAIEAASLPSVGAVEVKGLVWEQNSPRVENSLWARVDPINRYYSIEPESRVFRLETTLSLSEHGSDNMGLFPTLGAAKAAAQSDYEQRILSALHDGRGRWRS